LEGIIDFISQHWALLGLIAILLLRYSLNKKQNKILDKKEKTIEIDYSEWLTFQF